MFERILVPLDSSNLADMVLPYAELLAGVLDSELTLIYICEPEEERFRTVHDFYLRKIAELVTIHVREFLPDKPPESIRVHSLVTCGKPHEEITDYARKNGHGEVVRLLEERR